MAIIYLADHRLELQTSDKQLQQNGFSHSRGTFSVYCCFKRPLDYLAYSNNYSNIVRQGFFLEFRQCSLFLSCSCINKLFMLKVTNIE